MNQLLSYNSLSKPRIASLALFWPYFCRYRRQIVMALIALFMAAGTTLTIPMAVRRMIDFGLASNTPVPINQYFLALGGLVVLLAASSAMRYYFVTWLGERVVSDIRHDVFAHVITLDAHFFDQIKSGEILSRLTADTTQIKTIIGSSISIGLRNFALMIGAIAMMIVTSNKLSALVLLAIPFIVMPLIAFGRQVRIRSKIAQDNLADMASYASEAIHAARLLQSFTAEAHVTQKFTTNVERAFLSAQTALTTRALLIAFAISTVFASILAVLWFGTQDYLTGAMSLGSLSQFVIYSVLAAGALGSLSQVWAEASQAAGAAERLNELLNAKTKVKPPNTINVARAKTKTKQTQSCIQFQNVSFSYAPGAQKPILNDISFNIEPGETVAIVGPSGAGKSTLFALMMRAYDVTEGSIHIDGIDVRHWPLSQLRQQLAIVPQDATLFADQVDENIRLGRIEAPVSAIHQAAEAASASAFINNLPHGYQTILSERGSNLSGGQRQRIAIARALLKDAPILLLDEATSALDAENEELVQNAISNLMQQRTTLIIAHRLATVRKADRILVMEKGKLVESGIHNSLINHNGLYARLAALQFKTV